MKVPLEKARICLECDTIHDLVACPECGSDTYYYLANWIKPQRPPRPAPEPPPAEREIFAPAGKKKNRHLLRKALFAGAGLIAAYQFLFKRSRRKPRDE